MSQDVAENDTGTFRCRGNGIPEPKVKWLINGTAVTSEFTLAYTHTYTYTYIDIDIDTDTSLVGRYSKYTIYID